MRKESIAVLHVDDDASFRDLAKESLEHVDSSLSVTSVPSATAGLEQLGQQEIECVVSDYEMPGRDGLEFLEAVRAKHSSLPFVLFTGKGSEEIAEQAINSGADAYYQKKGGLHKYTILSQHINTLVDNYRATQRLDYLEREKHIADGGVDLTKVRQSSDQSESFSIAIVKKVAAREETDPITLPPLHESIDPTALEVLIPPTGESKRGAESITFSYLGYEITVTAERQIFIDR